MSANDDPALEDREIPGVLADQFRVSLGLDDAPATLAEWVAETGRLLTDEHVPDGPGALCLTGSSRHEARFDGERHNFRCFFDLLLLPFVLGDPADVHVRSRSPVTGTVVSGRVNRERVSIEPATAVVSFGAATDVVSAEYLDVPASLASRRFCPYINAFPDEAAYDRWATGVEDGVTMPLSMREGFAVARRLVGREQR